MSRNLAVDAARKAVELSQEALQVDLFGPNAIAPDRLAWLREHGYLPSFPAGVGVQVPGGGLIDPWAMAVFMGQLLAMANRRKAQQMRRWSLDDWAEHVGEHIEREAVRREQVAPAALPAPEPQRASGRVHPEQASEVIIPEIVDPVARQAPPAEIVDTFETRGPAHDGAAFPPASAPYPPRRPPAPPLPPSGGGGGEGPPIPAPPPGLGPVQREAWIQARTRAGEYARGLGNDVAADMETLVAEVWEQEDVTGPVNEEQRLVTREAIREEVADAIAHGRTADELARRLAHKTGDWARDWKRIAMTELQGAHNDAVIIDAVRREGEGARIARIPEPGACVNCRRLFLDVETGRPRIFTAAELLDNGTNVGKRAVDWRPTAWPLHPRCVCGTEHVPAGLTYDDGWELTKERAA